MEGLPNVRIEAVSTPCAVDIAHHAAFLLGEPAGPRLNTVEVHWDSCILLCVLPATFKCEVLEALDIARALELVGLRARVFRHVCLAWEEKQRRVASHLQLRA